VYQRSPCDTIPSLIYAFFLSIGCTKGCDVSYYVRMRLRAVAGIIALALLAPSLAPTLAHAQQLTLPLWPHATPEPPQTTTPETDDGKPISTIPAGTRLNNLANVTVPTLTLYPAQHPTGAAAVVFPGGGYTHLSYNKEGVTACEWLNSVGVTCVLVKYRVPEPHYPTSYADLEDAQQAMRITRAHAKEWHIAPNRLGVVGFSAGGNLAALLSTHFNDIHITSTPAAADANVSINARPDFAILVYPAYLALDPDQTALDPTYEPTAATPPTFIATAENDKTYARNSLVYYTAMLNAGMPAEMHFFSAGGHGFGVYPVGAPSQWTELATHWLRIRGFIPAFTPQEESGPSSTQQTPSVPCPYPTLPSAGRPDPKSGQPVVSTDPNCPNP
jgi:acetyl esterase/lipase